MPAVGAAIGAAWTALTATAIGSIAANLLVSVAVSALATALQGKPDKPRPAGVQTRMTTTGDSTCQSLIFGRYATAGNHVCPPMTHGSAGGTPNAYMTQVIDVSDLPVAGLAGLWIDDRKVTLGQPAPAGALFPDHQPVTSAPYNGKAWVRFYDGTQTSHSESLTTIGAVERPWQYDMIGRDVAYAIIRFKFDDKVFRGMPEVLFEVDGIGFYDPRKDSSMGGSGDHRWGQRDTYEPSENTVVQIYNVLRGIDLPGGGHWGGRATAGDLPLANWFAAMNECDVLVDGEPQYRTSYEVRVGPEQFGGSEPAGVVEDLLRCCSGQVSEFGGTWRIRVGPVGMPVAVLSDDDIIITEDQTFLPFPSLRDSYNAIQAQYPERAERWVSKEAPPIYNPAWEARDGGRRRIASLSLGACPYPAQVQRIMQAYIKDEQRDRVHEITLPPDYAAIEPLDAIAWTSDRNGYTHKVFEVGAKTDGSRSLLQRVSLRERDPSDYDPVAATPVPSAPVTTNPVPVQGVPGWDAEPWELKDAGGISRRPAIRATWDPEGAIDASGLRIAVRLLGDAGPGEEVAIAPGMAGHYVYAAVVPGASYQMRAQYIVRRATEWSAWKTATAPDIRFGSSDMSGPFLNDIEETAARWGIKSVDQLPATGGPGQIVQYQGRLYRWNGTQWSDQLYAGIEPGTLTAEAFISGLQAIERVTSLPSAPHIQGRVVYLEGDTRLYRNDGTGWTADVDATQVVGQLQAHQIAANTITAREMAIGDFSNLILNSDLIDSGGWTFHGSAERIDDPPAGLSAFKGGIRFLVSGSEASARYVGIPVIAGERYYFRCMAMSRFASGHFTIQLRVHWYDRDGQPITPATGGQPVEVIGNDTVEPFEVEVEAPEGAHHADVRIIRRGDLGSESNNAFAAKPIFQRMGAGRLVVDGEITSEKINAGWLLGDRLQANYLDINDQLTMMRGSAFRYNRAAVDQDDRDGMYFGRDWDDSFGFSVGRKVGNRLEQIKASLSGGLELYNPRFYMGAGTVGAWTMRTGSHARTAVTPGNYSLIIEAVGGGGGGAGLRTSFANEGHYPGSAGGNTVVRLYDGNTLKRTITANGGAPGTQAGWRNDWADNAGIASQWSASPAAGTGGLSATGKHPNAGEPGKPGVFAAVSVNLAGWADPQIEIMVGSGGGGGVSPNGPSRSGGNGAGGAVRYRRAGVPAAPASLIRSEPDQTGTFVGAALPDLGAGLWMISLPPASYTPTDNNNSPVNISVPAHGLVQATPGDPYMRFAGGILIATTQTPVLAIGPGDLVVGSGNRRYWFWEY